jgi:alpha-beta hydrolase superfamily lysophospholipase
VDAPILLIHGNADTSVPVASARAVRDAFAAAGKTNLSYLEYAGADHRFTSADGASVFPRVEIDLVSWLKDTGAMPAAEADEFARRVKRAHPEAFR